MGKEKIYDTKLEEMYGKILELKDIKILKLDQLEIICNATITSGCDVVLSSKETEHFSLTETDQINLNGAVAAVQQGAAGYPYHADGDLCKLYSAEDIMAIATAATAHKLYHTTYCNHLNVWIRRLDDKKEIDSITYGTELPKDLKQNMDSIIAMTGGKPQ